MNNADRLHAFIDTVWNRGEAEQAARFIADSYTIHSDPGDPWEGRVLDAAGFVDRVTTSRAAAPDQHFEIRDTIGDGDKVAVCWDWSGTHSAPIGGIPATGRRLTMSGITVYYFENGRICGHRQCADRLGIYRQVAG